MTVPKKSALDRRAFMKSSLCGAASFLFGGLAAHLTAKPRYNVVIIVSDALRADMLAKSVAGRTVMPNVTQLAASGALFTSCIAPSSWTLLSVPGILSSTPPLPGSPVIDYKTPYFPDSAVNIAEVFSDARLQTLAVVKNPWLHREPGHDRLYQKGFTLYYAPGMDSRPNELAETFGDQKELSVYEDASLATARAIRTIENRFRSGADFDPFFLYLHYMDTHEPYDPPEPFRSAFTSSSPVPDVPDWLLTRAIRLKGMARNEDTLAPDDAPLLERSRQLYAGAAAYVDGQVARLVDYLRSRRLYDRTIIVFTADHGEEFGEHGWIGHSRTLHREVLEVPLVLTGPGVPMGLVNDDLVSSTDIAPALLRLSRVAPRCPSFHGDACALLDGRSTRDVLSTTLFRPNEPIPTYVSTSLTTMTGQKYIRTSHLDETGHVASLAHELFDHRRDPAEQANLADSHPDLCMAHSQLIDAAIAARYGKGGMTIDVPDELRLKLRSLGYLN